MSATRAAPPGRKRILLVEDDIPARDVLASVLGARYEVVVAGDGAEGAEMAAELPPDLILTDVTMPRLDGVAMVRQIRERQGLRVPVIFLTALDAPTAVIAGIAAGARHYITKPVDLGYLEKRIGRALR